MKRNPLLILFIFFSLKILSQTPCSSGFLSNGTDDFIEIPNSTHINTNNTAVGDRTIEMWFKTSDITTKQVLFEEGGGVNAFIVYIEGGRVYSGQYINNGGSSSERLFFRSGSGDISTGTWYHIAYTLSSGSTAKWYLNGVEQDSQTAFAVKKHTGDVNFTRSGGNIKYPSSLVSNWNASSIGSSNGENYTSGLTGNISTSFNFDGNTALFRIWSVARTQSQIDTNKGTYLTSGTGLVAYQNGDEVFYRANTDSSPTSNVTSNNSGTSYTWTGGTSVTWTTTSNWSGGSNPDATKAQTIVINSGTNDPEITAEVKAGNLTVDSGATITVKSGGTLNILYSLTNNGTIIVEDGGSLIFSSCNASLSGSGTYTVKRDSPSYSGSYFFSYWSSPLIQTDSDPAVLFPGKSNIYYFNASSTNADWALNSGSDFIPGVGYAIRHSSTGSYTTTFTGKINEGEISVPLYYNTNLASTDPGNVWNAAGDNLIGNPYPSVLDWDLVVTDEDNSMLEGTIYFWDQTVALVGDNDVNDYKQYNMTGGSTPGVTGKIGSGQGFFARVTVGGTMKLKPAHQVVASNTQFFKSRNNVNKEKKNRSWFSLSDGNKYSSILIGFVNGATENYDRLYDSPYDVTNISLGLYSVVEGNKKTTIQGLPKLKDFVKTVPVGFIVDKIGSYSIKINEEFIDSKYKIYLEDTEQKKIIDLRVSDYNFLVNKVGENNTRFKFHFTQHFGFNESLFKRVDSNYHIFIDGNTEIQILLRNDLVDSNIRKTNVYNLNGQAVMSFSISDKRNISSLKSGVYIVKVQLSDGKFISKKILFRK